MSDCCHYRLNELVNCSAARIDITVYSPDLACGDSIVVIPCYIDFVIRIDKGFIALLLPIHFFAMVDNERSAVGKCYDDTKLEVLIILVLKIFVIRRYVSLRIIDS